MSTRAILTPFSAEFPTTNFPALSQPSQNRPVLGFDASTDETCYWTLVAPQGMTGALTLVVTYRMASATTGNVILNAAVEAITDGDATDTDTASSFDTVNASATTAVPGTAGYIDQISITLTNADSAAVADMIRISLSRDADNGSDTATGDLEVLAVEFRDAA